MRCLSGGRLIWSLLLVVILLLPACRLFASTPVPEQTVAPPGALFTPTSPKTETLPAAITPPVPTGPVPAGTAEPAIQPAGADQSAAMLPFASGDLQSLGELNHYDITVDIDYANHSFKGSQRVEITNRETVPLDSLYFRLLPNGGKSYGGGSLDVTRLAVDKEVVEGKLSLSDSVLEVPLDHSLEGGQSVRVDFEFSGAVPVDFGADKGGEYGYGIYNFTDGVLALSGWYPILAVYDEDGWNLDPVSAIGDSVYSDTAFYTVEINTSENVVLAATGAREPAGKANVYVSGPARDFFIVLSPEFRITSQEVDGVQVNSYNLPGDETAGQETLQVAVESLQIYNQRFGPYPYKELDVVEAPMQNALGVEYPEIVLIASGEYSNPDQAIFPITVAHEVAHQWWYGVVGNDVFEEPWLDEALATYSSNVYLQDAVGQNAYEGYLEYWLQTLSDLRSQGLDDVVTRSLAYFEDPDTQASYGAVVYNKGALFFDALRQEIGDEAFFTGLQRYYQAHRYGIARTADLLDAFESAAGHPLDDLYQEWLFSAQD